MEREIGENRNERMSDRPRPSGNDFEIDVETIPTDDVDAASGDATPAVTDV
ncbi:MAG: hypothetical protein NVSMB5_05600 [Candidatus Velthaea sp.]